MRVVNGTMFASRANPKLAAGCQSISMQSASCTHQFSIQPIRLIYTGVFKSRDKGTARLTLAASLGSSSTGTEASLNVLRRLHVLLPLASRVVSPWLQPKQLTQRLDVNSLTRVMLAWSILPALLLALQPLAANSLAAAHPPAWQGSLCDMFSFTVLFGVFITCEPAAAAASAVSAAGAALALVQPPGQLPAQAVCATLLLAAAAAATVWAVSLDSILPARQQQQRQQQRTSTLALMRSSASDTSSYLAGSVSCQQQRQPSRSSAQDAWQPLHAIQQVLGVLGGGLLLQFCWSAVSALTPFAHHASSSWLPAVALGAAAAVAGNCWLSAAGRSNPRLHELKLDWPAWSATLLLILQALRQLVLLTVQPDQLRLTTSTSQLLLLVLANSLMVPRALATKQFMWFTGTCSGTLLAAGQLVILAAHSVSRHTQPTLLTSSLVAAASAAGVWIPWYNAFPCAMSLPRCSSLPDGSHVWLWGVLLAWLWFSVSVLRQGGRWMQAGHKVIS